ASIDGLPRLFDRAAEAAEGFAGVLERLDKAPVSKRIAGDMTSAAGAAVVAAGAWGLLRKTLGPTIARLGALRTALGLGAAATAGWVAVAATGAAVGGEMGRQAREAETFVQRFMATVS